ncbi:MAG: Ada metal-binding domain-containing protein, partial [Nitrosopumilaceae archaeon]
MKLYKVIKRGEVVELPYPGNYAGYKKGKIFGRLDCKSGMRMNRENRVFFYFWEDAVEAGYRPCKNCRPEEGFIFSRAKCDHQPFGMTGGMSLSWTSISDTKVQISCALCNEELGEGVIN